MSNNTFKVDLRADNLEEFKEDVIEYVRIRWGEEVNFDGFKIPDKKIPKIEYEIIHEAICKYFNVSPIKVKESRIRGTVSIAKSFIAYFAWLEGHTLVNISKKLYHSTTNDHTNIIYRRDRVIEGVKEFKRWKTWYKEIEEIINNIKNESI